MVEHDLAKVGVASPSLVFRSKDSICLMADGIFFAAHFLLPEVFRSPGGGIGRRAGLKILFAVMRVRVQFPSGALSLPKGGLFYAINAVKSILSCY